VQFSQLNELKEQIYAQKDKFFTEKEQLNSKKGNF